MIKILKLYLTHRFSTVKLSQKCFSTNSRRSKNSKYKSLLIYNCKGNWKQGNVKDRGISKVWKQGNVKDRGISKVGVQKRKRIGN